MLVNDLIHGLYPEAITIGEDVSADYICLYVLISLACIYSNILASRHA